MCPSPACIQVGPQERNDIIAQSGGGASTMKISSAFIPQGGSIFPFVCSIFQRTEKMSCVERRGLGPGRRSWRGVAVLLREIALDGVDIQVFGPPPHQHASLAAECDSPKGYWQPGDPSA